MNPIEKEKIRNAPTPKEAKRLGRQTELRSDWESVKDGIMENILRAKFKSKEMRDRLDSTKGHELIEGTLWHDMYWGICICKKHNSTGKNMLGTLLMKIRDEN